MKQGTRGRYGKTRGEGGGRKTGEGKDMRWREMREERERGKEGKNRRKK